MVDVVAQLAGTAITTGMVIPGESIPWTDKSQLYWIGIYTTRLNGKIDGQCQRFVPGEAVKVTVAV